MRSETTRASPQSRSNTTNLPRRRTSLMRRPRRRAPTTSAGSGSVRRTQRDSNSLIVRSTTSPRSCRAMVSTSGSSGIGGRGNFEALHLVPVGPGSNVDDERHVELVRPAHFIAEQSRHPLDLEPRHLGDELVVHLQEDTGMQVAVVQRAVHARHRDLHDVRGVALYWHVDRHPLRGVADRVHPACHIRDVAPPPEERFDVALLDAERLCLEDVPADLPVALEVLVDEALRLFAGHLHPPREAEIAHAVNDPEVEHLRDVALLARDGTLRHTEAGSGRAPVDIGARAERIQERGILRHVRKHAKLDLRVVRGDKDAVRRAGNERAADAAAERCADRDVLEIRGAAREPSGGGDGLLKRGVNATRFRIDEPAEPFRVCRAKLLDLAVFEDLLDHRWAPRSSSRTVASVEKPVPVRRPRGSFSSSNRSDWSCFGELSPNSWPTTANASCSIRATSRANSSPSERR